MTSYSIRLAENPNPKSTRVFVAPTVEGRPQALHYPGYSKLLRQVMKKTGCVDPQAAVVADLYGKGSISRPQAAILEATLATLDRADELVLATSSLEDSGGITADDAKHVRTALGYGLLRQAYFLDPNGMVGTSIDQDGHVVPDIYTGVASTFGQESTEYQVAHQLTEELHLTEADILFAYQARISWPEDASYREKPNIVGGEHAVLGIANEQNGFTPIATVFNYTSPTVVG
jgi:hypothetical protein